MRQHHLHGQVRPLAEGLGLQSAQVGAETCMDET